MERLRSYFRNFVKQNVLQPDIWGITRDVTKWGLDLVRNMVVVGALKYLANRTGAPFIKAVAEIASLFLYLYCLSYISTWTIHPFNFVTNRRVERALELIAAFVFSYVAIRLATFALEGAIKDLAEAQAR